MFLRMVGEYEPRSFNVIEEIVKKTLWEKGENVGNPHLLVSLKFSTLSVVVIIISAKFKLLSLTLSQTSLGFYVSSLRIF